MKELLLSYALPLTLVVGVLVGWVAVQSAWRRTFGDTIRDPDVLAGRGGCGSCGCTNRCERDGAVEENER
ncbi:MAG: hypothetical protein GWN46_07605 [Gammaproteobacteria bacterium]|nr:hypothetical protein [Gammaproteobacteria bacterium]